MTDHTEGAATAAPASPRTNTVSVAGRELTLERISARKAAMALAELRAVTAAVPQITRVLGDFRREYEATNVVELDRVQARIRYPARPILGDDGQPVRDEAGELTYAPSVIDTMSEEDWAAAGGKIRLPKSPSLGEEIAAVFPLAIDAAEAHVFRLLALFVMSNQDVAGYRKSGELDQRLADRADELLDDALADEVLELAVVAGELVDSQFRRKAAELGDRLGNALSLVGLSPTRTRPPTTPPTQEADTATPSSSRPTSSTDSPSATPDGRPTSSSSSPTSSSPSSATGSTSTSSSDELESSASA